MNKKKKRKIQQRKNRKHQLEVKIHREAKLEVDQLVNSGVVKKEDIIVTSLAYRDSLKKIKFKYTRERLDNRERVDLTELGQFLRENMPKSEKWFYNLWLEHRMLDSSDKFNFPIGYYIPDVSNEKYKYIIEIDGSIHSTPDQIGRDRKKDKYYFNLGYKIYRLKAYDYHQFLDLIKWVTLIKSSKNSNIKTSPTKVILRRKGKVINERSIE